MILEEETFEAYGYYARDLRPYSRKRIVAACELCGEFKLTTKTYYRTFCKSCIRKGTHNTEEQKAKNSARMKGNTHF